MATLDRVNAKDFDRAGDPDADTDGTAADAVGTGTTDAAARPPHARDHLDLRADPVELTAALIDIPSVSRDEARIADAVEAATRIPESER